MYLLTALAAMADRLDPTIGNFLAAFRDERIPVELSAAILAAAAILLAAVILSAAIAVTRIRNLRALIRVNARKTDFAANFATIDRQLSKSMFRDSWREYRKCLRPGDGGILYLRRPDEFFGLHAVDSKVFPARFFAAAHGYFIGIGLVLTFIGLVAALKFAATGVASSDLAVAKDALDALLAAAAFKFMTSIVGLGSSLGLSIAARSATYAVESAALGFARDLERAMQPIFSECVAYDGLAVTRAQLGQLKRIETGLTQLALQQAAAPAVNAETQTAAMLQEVLAGFRAEMRNTAGGEMKQLAGKLSDVGGAIGAMQSHIGRSGEHFAEQIDLAATRLLAAASKLQESVDKRADAAGARFEARIESLATAFSRGEAQLAGAADKAAGALAASAGELDDNLRAQLGQMRDIVTLLGRTRDALGESASSWTQCTAPVLAATEASRQVAGELGQIVGQISAAQHDMSDTAKAVAQLSERVGVVWENYRRRFEKVDDEMQAVFERLQGGTRSFGEEMMDFVGKLDTSLASGMQALSVGTEELRQTAQMFVIPGNAKAA